MAIETAPVPTSYDEWRDRRWRLTGALIGLAVVVVATIFVTTGVRPATYADLLSDVASGKVDEVQVVGAGPETPGDLIELRWTVLGGVLAQYAEVRLEGADGIDAPGEQPISVTSEDPRDTLRGIDSGLRITEIRSVDDPAWTFREWIVPGPVALLALVAWLATLLLVVGGPEPWRATRWAWFWLWMFTGPLGAVIYLLLGGPLGMARPRHPRRRLTGGWAFLIGVVLFGGGSGG